MIADSPPSRLIPNALTALDSLLHVAHISPDWFENMAPGRHPQLVFTYGACSNNGLVNARDGVEITLSSEEHSWSISVTLVLPELANAPSCWQ